MPEIFTFILLYLVFAASCSIMGLMASLGRIKTLYSLMQELCMAIEKKDKKERKIRIVWGV